MDQSTIEARIADVKRKKPNDEDLAQEAVALAADILKMASAQQKLSERYQGWKMARMMEDASGKALTLAMADQVFRPPTEARSASQFRHLIHEYGVPDYLPVHEQLAMRVGALASAVAPEMIMPAVTSKMRSESDEVILPSEDKLLKPHLAKRRKTGTRMNINQLGEAILGEEEAARRLQLIVERLSSPDCEYISVKISAIYSQINLMDYAGTLEEIKERLRTLYRTALKHQFEQPDGTKSPKFVNLDMEEYRDLHLTCDAFKQVLMEEEFLAMEAGIVLQAYLPDSFVEQQELTAWTRKRVGQGGGKIKIRLVKGANLAMEQVEASLHDWPQAPYFTKAEVDANFKRMVHYGCEPENAEVVRLGIASHNLFEIAYALLLRAVRGVEDAVEFEMLEGMANHQARAVQQAADGLLLYAPVVKKEDFHSAIAYLVRRLDENTQEENFLHDLFGLKEGDENWGKQRKMFLDACRQRDEASITPNRIQDRNTEAHALDLQKPFRNEPDTDWSLRHNQKWVRDHVEALAKQPPVNVPVQIAGETRQTGHVRSGSDPSRPGVEAYRYSQADAEGIEQCLQCAVDAREAWIKRGVEGRAELLKKAGVEMARKRAESIAIMVMDGGKAAQEADAEISEAIDFANYYADSLGWDGLFDGTEFTPLGTVVVSPPWNFPYAIPCGGILAALMAGNTVIFKPAAEAVLIGWVMVNHLWDAGIPREVLQFVTCADRAVGRTLLTDERADGVILTGAYETARMFQDWKPEMRLFAETSGKNSLIIMSAADPDQAVKDLVKSAFGHSGQKCSAASLAIIEGDLYDSPGFRRQLRDAAASLKVGPSWDPASLVTPVIREPDVDLLRALTILDEGEEWLLEPKMLDDNPCLWSPGIKLGVAPDSWYRRTECFGPVLGLVRAKDLDDAIRIQNDSDFGLTGGIHTLDDREIAVWRERVEVGNAYINRGITGAIVQRQPFGGWKRSCFGPGAKAGGPNYVSLMGHWNQASLPQCQAVLPDRLESLLAHLKAILPDDGPWLDAAAGSCAKWWREEFSKEHDPTGLHGESNHFRYRPLKRVLLRADGLSKREVAQCLLAAATCGVELLVSVSEDHPELASMGATMVVEGESALIKRLAAAAADLSSLRTPAGASPELRRAANDAALQLVDWPVLANGRLELMHYLREQSISETTHRYGNIIPKPADL